MIDKIKLKFGSSSGQAATEIEATPITVFVGPNNSGKSKVLMEVEQFCKNGIVNTNNLILQDIDFNPLADVEGEITNHTLTPTIGELVQPNNIIYGKGNWRNQLNKTQLSQFLSNPNQKNTFCGYYVTFNTIRIDGASRINLIKPEIPDDLQAPARNKLSVLFRDNAKRSEVRRIIYEAFKKYFVIDPTSMSQLRIRLSDTEPDSEITERGIHDAAVEFHKNALDIQQASDGVKAFTGIITTTIAGDPKIILIDEPEAFLHPSLSYKLGKELGNTVASSNKDLVVSTHSSNFLMGCIQSGAGLNIVRLTYSNNVPTARLLPSEKVLKLMRHPLLRSTGVLNGLFYEYVIVTESDSDRAFYQEINERLIQNSLEKGISNCLFLNAQNKQTVHEIIKPLREMGIPCAAIVDIDIIKEGGTVWSKFLKSAFIPEVTFQSTTVARPLIKGHLDRTGVNYKREGGIRLLNGAEKEACSNLFEQLSEYGLFVVPNGELESWLKNLGAAGHSPKWLIEIFEKLGENPEDANYVKPAEGDVWAFMTKIKSWLDNGSRKGIPE
jgi:ABC-type cobalamin/Fe3+-siderophores transport system ATPase subunit